MSLSVEDKFEIMERLHGYFYAHDERDVEKCASFYTSDARVEEPDRQSVGIEEIKVKIREGGESHPPDHHWLGNMLISGDGDRASVKSYVLVADGPRIEDDSYGIAVTGIQHYELVRTDGVWLIEKLVVQRAPIPEHVKETWKHNAAVVRGEEV